MPETRSTAAWIVLAVGLVFYGTLSLRAARTYLLTRRRADLLVVFGTVLLSVALVPAFIWGYVDLGWWLGHLFELIGIGLVGRPVALDLHRGAQSRALVGDLRATELVRAADAYLGPSVRALLVRLAEKDAYTETHTRGRWRSARSRSARSWACPTRGCASWRSARSPTTWASSRCRTRSSRSRRR